MNVQPFVRAPATIPSGHMEIRELLASFGPTDTLLGAGTLLDFEVSEGYEHVEIYSSVIAASTTTFAGLYIHFNNDLTNTNYYVEYLDHTTAGISRNRENRPIIGWVNADATNQPAGYGNHSMIRVNFAQHGAPNWKLAEARTIFRWVTADHYYRDISLIWWGSYYPIRRIRISIDATGVKPPSTVFAYGCRTARVLLAE